MGESGRRLAIYIEKHQRTVGTRARPILVNFRDGDDPRTRRDDHRLFGFRVGRKDIDHIAGLQ